MKRSAEKFSDNELGGQSDPSISRKNFYEAFVKWTGRDADVSFQESHFGKRFQFGHMRRSRLRPSASLRPELTLVLIDWAFRI